MKRLFFPIILFFFAIPSIAYGATEFVSVVDPGNGDGTDYTSLSAWENAVQTNLTVATTKVFSGTKTGTLSDNATMYLCRGGAYQTLTANRRHATATQILAQTISNGSFVFQSGDIWYTNNTCDSASYFIISDVGDSASAVAKCRTTTGAADTTAVVINGWTTSVTNYVKIWTDPGENYRHSGKWDDSKYNLSVTTAGVTGFEIFDNHVRIEGLQVYKQNNWSAVYVSTQPSGSAIYISNSIIKGNANTGGIYIDQFNGDAYISDTVVYNNGMDGFYIGDFDSWGTVYCYNCNSINNGSYGFLKGGVITLVIKNCLASENLGNGYIGGPDVNYSASSDGTADDFGGTGNRVNQTFSFVSTTPGSEDFHLQPSDTGARNYGTDLSSDPDLPFSTDIDGETRPGETAWDIGADEFIPAPILIEIKRNVNFGRGVNFKVP